MRNKFISGAVATTGIFVFSALLSGCGEQKAVGGPIQSGPAEVGVVTVEPQRLVLTSELPGRTAAYVIAEVRPQVSGIIQRRPFTEGEDVKANEVLYQIDPASFKAAYASAKAAVSKAEAVLATTKSKAERYKQLLPARAVSQQDYEDMVGLARQAEADVEATKAALETARINLDYTRVASPISGRVGRSAVTTGALVTANQAAPLCTVQQLDPIYVDVTQSSAEVLRLKQSLAKGLLKSDGVKEAKVRLILEDGTQYPIEGTLKFSEVTVDQSTGSITLRAVFNNPQQILLPGMYVRAVVEQGVNEEAVLVPQQGVTHDSQGNAVAMLVGADEKVEPRMVKVDRAVGDKWLVSDGLKTGDRVIVEGLQKAAPGAPVTVAPFSKTAKADSNASSTVQ